MSSSFGTKLSSPTNSVSSARRGLSRSCSHNSLSAVALVMYWCGMGIVTGASLGRAEGAIRRRHGLRIAEAEVFLQKLIRFQHAAEFRFGGAIAVVRVGMELFRLGSKRGGDIGERAAELHTHDRIGIHRVIHGM